MRNAEGDEDTEKKGDGTPSVSELIEINLDFDSFFRYMVVEEMASRQSKGNT